MGRNLFLFQGASLNIFADLAPPDSVYVIVVIALKGIVLPSHTVWSSVPAAEVREISSSGFTVMVPENAASCNHLNFLL